MHYHFNLMTVDTKGETNEFRPWSYFDAFLSSEDEALELAKTYVEGMYKALRTMFEGSAVRVKESDADEYIACYVETGRGLEYYYGDDANE